MLARGVVHPSSGASYRPARRSALTVIRRLIVATIVAVAFLVPAPAAHADGDLAHLLAVAERDGWGPAEWEWFEHYVEVHRFLTWVDSIVAPTGDLWDRIAVCETGGAYGAAPGTPAWWMNGSRFSGGLGFANSTWRAYRYEWMPEWAGDANREEQILVAERIRWELPPRGSLHGKWGCAPRVGAP